MKKLITFLACAAVLLAAAFMITRPKQADSVPPAASSEPQPASSTASPESAPAQSESAASSAESAPSAVSRAETSVVDFFIEGEKESVPSTLYIGDGYSLYVPDDSWTVSKNGSTATWISTDNENVGFSISTVKGKSAADARSEYIADSGFEFEDLNGGEFGDPLLGWNEDGDALGIMSAEKGGKVYIIAWTYPEEAAEGFGARLQQIAETFELI